MSKSDSQHFVPVGAVIAYAGNAHIDDLNRHGWALCDGSSMEIAYHQELYDAIGNANGATDSDHFNLPDLRGCFLRGTDVTELIDPGPRYAPPGNGNAGINESGSLQTYATATPSDDNNFYCRLRYQDASHNSFEGSNWDMLVAGDSQKYYSTGGGDPESRPINAYVDFLIKTDPGDGDGNGRLYPGMIVPYAGDKATPALLQTYVMCNGWAFTEADLEQLYKALGTAHGTDGNKVCLPDYKGRFLRGVDHGSGHDPEAAGRHSPLPSSGAKGDNIGSIQDGATGRPTITQFYIHVPLGSTSWTSDRAAGNEQALWNPDSVDADMTVAGGDLETRPVNIAVDFYMLTVQETDVPLFPIGGVIAVPGIGKGPPSTERWLACNGESMPIEGQYHALYEAIGVSNGSVAADHFNLPDYRGYFLRGTDHHTGRDPEAAKRTARPGAPGGDTVGSMQGFATAIPVKHITASIAHMPTGEHENWPMAFGPDSTATVSWMDPMRTVAVAGGDPETRPRNVNVQFYIKYA